MVSVSCVLLTFHPVVNKAELMYEYAGVCRVHSRMEYAVFTHVWSMQCSLTYRVCRVHSRMEYAGFTRV